MVCAARRRFEVLESVCAVRHRPPRRLIACIHGVCMTARSAHRQRHAELLLGGCEQNEAGSDRDDCKVGLGGGWGGWMQRSFEKRLGWMKRLTEADIHRQTETDIQRQAETSSDKQMHTNR